MLVLLAIAGLLAATLAILTRSSGLAVCGIADGRKVDRKK